MKCQARGLSEGGVSFVESHKERLDSVRMHYAGASSMGAVPPSGNCRHLVSGEFLFFDIYGRELPCCYIKDATTFISRAVSIEQFNRGVVPAACQGCMEVVAPQTR